jgi:threonine synthase
MGFCQYHQEKRCQRLPKMMGFQAAGAAPLVLGHTVPHPDTIATAIRIGNPANRDKAIAGHTGEFWLFQCRHGRSDSSSLSAISLSGRHFL